MDLDSLLEEFRAEALDHVRAFEEELLKLERAPGNAQPVRRMFLAVHTIKGGAAMLNRAEMRDLSHAMEDVLAPIRDGQREFDQGTADLLFKGADLLRALILGGSAEPFRDAITMLEAELRERIAQSKAEAPAQSPEAPRPTDVIPPSETTRRALVVDDSPVVRMIEKALLEEADYQVEAVADGQEALGLVARERYALLVTGIENRGLGGIELARAARASSTNPNVAIILVTSGDASRTSEQAESLGITALLPKGQEGQRQLLEVARALRAGDTP